MARAICSSGAREVTGRVFTVVSRRTATAVVRRVVLHRTFCARWAAPLISARALAMRHQAGHARSMITAVQLRRANSIARGVIVEAVRARTAVERRIKVRVAKATIALVPLIAALA